MLRGPAGRLSSTEKAAKLGCFGLKIPGGDRESLKGNIKKKSGNGEGERELLSKSFYVKTKFKKKREKKKNTVS